MKKTLLYLLVFGAVYFVLDLAVFTGLSMIRSRTYTGETGGKINRYLSSEERPDTVILGDSRALSGINPDLLSASSFNLAHAGSDSYFLACVTAMVCEDPRRPNTILFCQGTTTPVRNKNYTLLKRLKPWYKEKAFVKKFIDKKAGHERVKLAFSKSYAFNGVVPSMMNNFRKSRGKKIFSNGFDSGPSTSRNTALVEAQFAARTPPVKPVGELESIEAMEFAIQVAQKNDVNLVLVILPQYRMAPDPRLVVFLEQAKAKWGVKVIDYGGEPLDELDQNPALWTDWQHLNIEGARVLTQDLERRLRASTGAAEPL